MKLLTLIRKIHLYSAFAVLAFLVMYFTTGFIMTHSDWFTQPEQKVLTVQHPLNLSGEISLMKLPEYIQKEFNIRGKLAENKVSSKGEINIEYVRPGYYYEVVIPPDRNTVTIITKKMHMYRTLVTFHRLMKYGGGRVYDLYILMMDVSSITLIIFAISGLYLWLKLFKRKLLGLLLLSLSIGYTLFVAWSFMNG